MPENSVNSIRNPHHEKALSAEDLKLNRKIIVFNRQYGGVEFTVVSEPHLGYISHERTFPRQEKTLVVVTLLNKNGEQANRPLGDMGVTPYEHTDPPSWNPSNFTIDANDQPLLPEPCITLADNLHHNIGLRQKVRLIDQREDPLGTLSSKDLEFHRTIHTQF
ncbi:MAG: hypothetical protein JWM07_604 [Candidatus Saccharibacteria bacterium]|nr:hypothetical protein [Candidatus Saccharibacteria bacterium]